MSVLPDPRPTAAKESVLVQQMFDRVAPRYDLANTVFSLGQDRHWRRVAALAAGVEPGDRVLDLAAGTGALGAELRRAGAWVVAADFSWNMLHAGAVREREEPPVAGNLAWCGADALALPFPDAAFDAATIAFGLRNLGDTAGGVREMARVLRPGGRLVVCEFGLPTRPDLRAAYLRYLVGAMPLAARLLTSDPSAYRYLAASIRAWPDQLSLAGLIAANGFQRVQWKNLTGGIVAVHRAVRSPQ